MKTPFKIFVLLFVTAITAQAQTFKVGDNAINVGIGLGSALDAYSSAKSTIGYSATYERGIWELGPGVLSLGGYLGRVSFKYSDNIYGSSIDQRWDYTIIGVRGVYHYTDLKVDKVDVYGGVMLSYNILKYDDGGYSGYGGYDNRPSGTAFAGGRYYFADNFSVYSELSYGVTIFNIGASFKF